jgi:hypothetical protein
MHDHSGTTARIQVSVKIISQPIAFDLFQLLDERQAKKLQRKEAYLSLYWP